MRASALILTLTLAFLTFSTPVRSQVTQAAPEQATGISEARQSVTGSKHMAVIAHPLASEAALEMLRAGGSSIDAAIAAQMVLTLVEPQSSGLGGGAFLVHYDAVSQVVTTYDGRETAPKLTDESRFLDADGVPIPWREAVFSGLSVGVPGVLAALEIAHKAHGKLPWADLFQPAIRHAREGFAVGPRLNGLLTGMGPDQFFAAARDYFFDAEGVARPVGHVLKNPDLADTLELIADGGADAFYLGEVARDIVKAVQSAPRLPGDMTLIDLSEYVAKERAPVCSRYRRHTICGMGPPSSGALAVSQTLSLLDGERLGTTMSSRALHLIAEAEKLAFADRNRYVADSDYVSVPAAGMLDPGYIAERRALIDAGKAMEKAEPGVPPMIEPVNNGVDASKEEPGTSQVSIVDGDGNALSMTTTIESAFGARLMVRGFLLNNELTDFSFRPVDGDGTPIANRVEAGKRPRSSMSPTLVFAEDGGLRMVLGSPGGSRIIGYVIKGVIAGIDWGLDAQSITALPNFGSRNGPFEIEDGYEESDFIQELEAIGQTIKVGAMTSGLNIIKVGSNGSLEGGSDPRREGVALAD